MEGKPKEVKWYKAGRLVDKPKTKTEDLGHGKYRLLIPEVTEEDAGKYSVKVTNEAGSAESTAVITVKPGITFQFFPMIAPYGLSLKFGVLMPFRATS